MGISFRIASCVDRLEERGDEIQTTALHRRQIHQYWSRQDWENAGPADATSHWSHVVSLCLRQREYK